ncbi:MAG TPA: hypothetical protein QGF02_02860 [Candidatus Babeliales bacterium]|nr:hypothetical protein [Candidatus Babeliales bacterium]
MKKLIFLTLIISSIGISLNVTPGQSSDPEMTLAPFCNYKSDGKGYCTDPSKTCYSSGYCFKPSN